MRYMALQLDLTSLGRSSSDPRRGRGRHLGLLLLPLVFLAACDPIYGGGGNGDGGPAGGDEFGTPVDQPIPTESEPTVIEDGVTGGAFSSPDHNVAVSIAAGSLPAGLRAHPTVTQAMAADPLPVDDEIGIAQVYQVDLASTADLVTTDPVAVTLAFDPAQVPADKRTARFIYARVRDSEWEASVPIGGRISGNTLTLDLRGLPKQALFTVVYSPSIRVALAEPAAKRPLTPTAPWTTNR